MIIMLKKGAASLLLGLGILLISVAAKIDPDYVRNILYSRGL